MRLSENIKLQLDEEIDMNLIDIATVLLQIVCKKVFYENISKKVKFIFSKHKKQVKWGKFKKIN